MYTVPQIKQVLVSENLLSEKEFAKYAIAAEAKGAYLIDYLIEKKVAQEEAVYQMMAQSINKPFLTLKDRNIRQDVLFSIPEPIAKTHEIIAYDKTAEGVLKIAAVDPDDIRPLSLSKRRIACLSKFLLQRPRVSIRGSVFIIKVLRPNFAGFRKEHLPKKVKHYRMMSSYRSLQQISLWCAS